MVSLGPLKDHKGPLTTAFQTWLFPAQSTALRDLSLCVIPSGHILGSYDSDSAASHTVKASFYFEVILKS